MTSIICNKEEQLLSNFMRKIVNSLMRKLKVYHKDIGIAPTSTIADVELIEFPLLFPIIIWGI